MDENFRSALIAFIIVCLTWVGFFIGVLLK